MRVLVLSLTVMILWAKMWAYPTSTNLAPSSEVMGKGEVRLELSTVSYGGLFRSGTEYYAYSQFGWHRLEWGFDIYRYPDGNGSYKTRLAFNVKARILDENGQSPSLVIGVLDVGKGLTASPYAVFGKTWGRSTWHLGIGRFCNNERWWVAAEYLLTSQLLLVIDRLSGRDGYSSLGVYWSLTENLELGVAVGIPNSSRNERAILLSLSWTR
ncbi:MAG: YjbH domain-containing protein [Armatimonadetes bacterium]|nr:YjbH domain-containing protein [Armatimonadota bacterium]